jgi:hypothetical protein
MAWVSVATMPGRLFHDVREEIDSGSPPATAIVGAAFVDDHLQRLIQQAQREASRVQRLKSIFNCLSSAMC